MEFIRPKAIFYKDYKKEDPYKDLIGIKVFRKVSGYPPDELKTSEEIRNRFDELDDYRFKHRDDIVGKLVSKNGSFLREVKLFECLKFEFRGSETYLEEKLFTRPKMESVSYQMYKGFKFNNYGSYLHNWFTNEELEVFNAPVPQPLDDEGYITMVEDDKTYITVNYTHSGLIQQESKIVYVSKNGRYIKYKGKNYYIKEQ